MDQILTSIDECITQSRIHPIFILKHSITCPISARAKREVDSFLLKNNRPAYLIIVQNERALSNSVAAHFSVKHESPQWLCIQNGEVKGVLNHNQISEANIGSLLSTLNENN